MAPQEGAQRFLLCQRDHRGLLTLVYNVCVEIHHGDGGVFVLSLAAFAHFDYCSVILADLLPHQQLHIISCQL